MNIYDRLKQSDAALIIFGAGTVGKFILERCRQNGLNVDAFCDNNLDRQGTMIDGVRVDGIKNLTAAFDKINFIVAVSVDLDIIVEQIKSFGDHEIYFASDFYQLSDIKTVDTMVKRRLEESWFLVQLHKDPTKPYLPNIDLTVTERCTLRCENCAHLLQYYQKPRDYPIEELKRALERLTEVFEAVGDVRVIGGETLMYGALDELIAFINEQPKILNAMIFTNGTIVPSDRLMEAIANGGRCKTCFVISNYGSLSRRTDDVLKKSGRYGVYCEVRSAEYWFRVPPLKKYNRSSEALEKIYRECTTKNCPTLLRGKLFRCPYLAHGVNLRAMPNETSNFVDLMATDDIAELRRQVQDYMWGRKYFSLCDYCYPRPLNIPVEDRVRPAADQLKSPMPYHVYE